MKKLMRILSVLAIFAVFTSFTTSSAVEYSQDVDHQVHISYAKTELPK